MTTNEQVQAAALKLCPFCGGGAYFYENEVDFTTKWSVSCEVCDANMDVCEDTKVEAATHWNARTRATPADPALDPATVEAFRKIKLLATFKSLSVDGYRNAMDKIRAFASGEERK